MTKNHPLIQTQGLSRDYPGASAGLDLSVLRDINIKIERGQFVAIMGSSGSGKSTLLNILGLLDRPTRGHYYFDGQDTSALGPDQCAAIRSEAIGFVFQSFNLLSRTTARENVELPLIYRGVIKAERQRRASKALEEVGLHDRLDHFPNQLSGGEQQRVAIARALVSDPLLLLADEPTGSLDSRTGNEILALLQRLHESGRTLIMVTHDPGIAARAECVISMRDGCIADGSNVRLINSGSRVS